MVGYVYKGHDYSPPTGTVLGMTCVPIFISCSLNVGKFVNGGSKRTDWNKQHTQHPAMAMRQHPTDVLHEEVICRSD